MQFRTVRFQKRFSTRERRDTPVVPPPAILAEVNRKNAERRAARGMTTDADRRPQSTAKSSC